jgi:hypothetical protein
MARGFNDDKKNIKIKKTFRYLKYKRRKIKRYRKELILNREEWVYTSRYCDKSVLIFDFFFYIK